MPTVTLLEPLLRFACNLKGCCCKKWFIPFQPEDFSRLLAAFDDEERERHVQGWRFYVDPDGTLERFTFGRVGEDDACQFLAEDGRCGLQVEKGTAALPHLCRAFPAYAHEGVDAIGATDGDDPPIDVHFDLMCPEVLDCIVDSEGPFRLVTVDASPGSALAVRASRVMQLPEISLGGQTLSLGELRTLRARIFTALGDASRPVIDRFAQVHYALARVANGEAPATFAVRDEDPVAPFDGYLDECVAIHSPDALARLLDHYRRFVFDLPLDESPWDALPAALAFDATWRDALDPRAPDFQPMLRRYLAYRFFSAFERSPAADQLSFTYGTIAHALATAFRYAVALSRWLGRPVDRTILKVSLGASEYVYRTVRVPTSAMPWFLP